MALCLGAPLCITSDISQFTHINTEYIFFFIGVETFVKISIILLVRSLGPRRRILNVQVTMVSGQSLLVKWETEEIVFKGDETLMSININDEWSTHRHVCGHSFNHLFILLLHFLFMHFRVKDSCPPARSQTCFWTPEPLVDIADGLWCPENAQPCVLNEQPWPQCFLGREEQKGLELQQLPIFSPSTSPTRSMIRKLLFEAHCPHLTLLGPEQLSPNWLQQQCLMRATECNFQFSSSRVKKVKRRDEFFNDKFYLTQYIKKNIISTRNRQKIRRKFYILFLRGMKPLKSGVYFTLMAHLNLETEFSGGRLDLFSDSTKT